MVCGQQSHHELAIVLLTISAHAQTHFITLIAALQVTPAAADIVEEAKTALLDTLRDPDSAKFFFMVKRRKDIVCGWWVCIPPARSSSTSTTTTVPISSRHRAPRWWSGQKTIPATELEPAAGGFGRPLTRGLNGPEIVSALPDERYPPMSALPPKADTASLPGHVRFVP